MNIRITAFQHTADIPDIVRVLELVKQQLTFIGYAPTTENVREVIDNAMKESSRAVLWVAYDGRNAVGIAFGNVCCGLESGGDYFWLNELFVAEDSRRQGVGFLLLEAVQDWAKDRGCTYLAMVTHPKNERAQELYASDGFELENLVWADKYL